MEWQSIAVVVCIALAVLYFVRSLLRTGRGGCGECGCSRPSAIDHDERERVALPLQQIDSQSGARNR